MLTIKTIIMNDIFIQKININKVRHLQNRQINITNGNERKHLIITGKNGSGKTSLLNEIRNYLATAPNNDFFVIQQKQKNISYLNNMLNIYISKIKNATNDNEKEILRNEILDTQEAIRILEKEIKEFSNIQLNVSNYEYVQEEYTKGNFIISFFDAKRITHLQTPNGIRKLTIKEVYPIQESANQGFIQYLVNLKAQRSFARDDNNMETVQDIDAWFKTFENHLKKIFEDEELKLEFDSENFDFNIIQKNKEKFNLNTLSDGYSAILNIVTELIMRMEKKSSKTYDLQGIVLIDEMETHLHIELQKIILPFLISIFPRIQFIVTTHSPFIINSVENALIYDLEHQISINDLSGYSVEGVIEGYFNSDKYSAILKRYVIEYEELHKKQELSQEETERLIKLKRYFKDLSKFMAPELELKIQQIELSKIK